MQFHPLTNFKMQNYYHQEPTFDSVYLRDNLPKIKDGIKVVNLDKYESVRTHWITFYINSDKTTFFESLGVEYIAKEIKIFIDN